MNYKLKYLYNVIINFQNYLKKFYIKILNLMLKNKILSL